MIITLWSRRASTAALILALGAGGVLDHDHRGAASLQLLYRAVGRHRAAAAVFAVGDDRQIGVRHHLRLVVDDLLDRLNAGVGQGIPGSHAATSHEPALEALDFA